VLRTGENLTKFRFKRMCADDQITTQYFISNTKPSCQGLMVSENAGVFKTPNKKISFVKKNSYAITFRQHYTEEIFFVSIVYTN
jgi:hypothetical protein